MLHCRDRERNLFAIDEFKTSRKNDLKKRFKLEFVIRVESNLSVSDPSILCTAGGGHQEESMLNCIFGVGFRFENIVKDLYLVAKNDEEMTLWVNEICKLCKLHRQHDEGDSSHAAESSISGMSMSSQSLDMSIIEQQQYAENIPESKQYHRMHHFKSVISHNSLPSNPNYNNLPDPLESSRSETSSMYSSRRTEDDSVSYTSGPPVPPPRTRHTLNRFVKNGQVGRLHMIPASTSMGQVVKVEDAEDSSGETLKLDTPEQYPESVTSSEGFPVYERNGKTLIRRAPPPVDRSNKPKNLRGEEEAGTRYRNLSRNGVNENGNYSATFSSRTSNYQQSETSKRRNLDYFEPTQMIENSSLSTLAATSTRSPTPSDIEYISVDVDRTLAFKQMRRAAQSTD